MTGPFDTKDSSHQRPPWYEPKPGRSIGRFLKRWGIALIFLGFMAYRIISNFLVGA